jgi:23S rRNA pseudouridine2604 synthase
LSTTDDEAGAPGVRLAKRVAALAACSRREAELLIESGAVQVDGVRSLLPQARVLPSQHVSIEAGARPAPIAPVTLLLHKPAGVSMEAAAQLLIEQNLQPPASTGQRMPTVLPRHLAGQRCVSPLEASASGLVVFTQVWGVARRLTEDASLIEHEVMVDVAGAVSDDALARLARPAVRVSINRQAEGRTGLRFALKGLQPEQIARLCEGAGLHVEAIKRIRIGRVPLAGLPPGQWRFALAHERF